MIRERRTDAKGTVYYVLTPENEADVEELQGMADRGELDARESFGDDPRGLGLDADEIDPDELEAVSPPRRGRRRKGAKATKPAGPTKAPSSPKRPKRRRP